MGTARAARCRWGHAMVSHHEKPPDVRICRVRHPSRVGTVPPSPSPHRGPRAGRAADTAPGGTGGRAPCATPVGSLLGGATPASRIIAARWRGARDPVGCWSRTSADLHAPQTSQLSCPATTGAHGCRWSPLRCARHGRHHAVTAGPRETAGPPAIPVVCVGSRGTTPRRAFAGGRAGLRHSRKGHAWRSIRISTLPARRSS